MAKIDVSVLKPIEREAKPYTFDDPHQSAPLELRLAAPSDLELGFANDLIDEYTLRYVKGGWVDDRGIFQKDPDVLIDGNGKRVVFSIDTLQFVCRLYIMQDVEDPKDAYTIEQFMMLIPYYPVAWQMIRKTVFDLLLVPKKNDEDTKTS